MESFNQSLELRISNAKSFKELAEIGIEHLANVLGDNTHIVSGPISTGGTGSIEKNIQRFSWTNSKLSKDHTIFDQIPFEDKIKEFKGEWIKNGGIGYCHPIIDEFYAPLFRSGYIKELHLMPDWESSIGSKREREICTELGISIVNIPEDFYKEMPEYTK